MAQLDFLIIFPLIWSLLFTLNVYYSISIKKIIPSFFGIKKFREKKLILINFYNFTIDLKFFNSYIIL